LGGCLRKSHRLRDVIRFVTTSMGVILGMGLPHLAAATASFTADIHLPLSGPAEAAALAANDFLSTQMDNKIDFHTLHSPHITLYLTEWSCAQNTSEHECKDPVVDALSSTLYGLASQLCNVSVGRPFVSGSYAMLNVTLTSCLQRYSDAVVNGTHQLALPNQTVPDWVYSLPEPTRSQKIHDVQVYGSPNVFDQFAPHVTIGWASNVTMVAAAVTAMGPSPPSTFVAATVALGVTGDHGTVLRGKDLAVFNLTTGGDPCRVLHLNAADCEADTTTSGGCVWCDIVDVPAFCTTRTNAHDLPRFPPHQCNWGMPRDMVLRPTQTARGE
jgi:hypothetical protein